MSSYSIVEEVKKAIQGEAYIAALGLALTIPDMCCGSGSLGRDYVSWFNQYVHNTYIKGDECYALRCSLLHEQTGEINGQRILQNRELWFTLNVPSNKNSFRIQLYVDDSEEENEKDKRIIEVDADLLTRQILSGYRSFIESNPDFKEEHPRIVITK